jgi:hypothetical protein
MYHPAAALRQHALRETMMRDMAAMPEALVRARAQRDPGEEVQPMPERPGMPAMQAMPATPVAPALPGPPEVQDEQGVPGSRVPDLPLVPPDRPLVPMRATPDEASEDQLGLF